MPLYTYRCDNGHEAEVFHPIRLRGAYRRFCDTCGHDMTETVSLLDGERQLEASIEEHANSCICERGGLSMESVMLRLEIEAEVYYTVSREVPGDLMPQTVEIQTQVPPEVEGWLKAWALDKFEALARKGQIGPQR